MKKKIAVLVIAAVNQPVYLHYIQNYWTDVIRYTNASVPNIDVFLLLENDVPLDPFRHLSDNLIVDPRSDLSTLCAPEHQRPGIPGILSKTVFAYEALLGDYDVFFRTNLSSLIRISNFDQFVQAKEPLIYSGAWVWPDALRENLLHYDLVGRDKSIRSISELDQFAGNSFASGAGYFLNAEEAQKLVNNQDTIRYDIIDDVAVGLMMPRYEVLEGFGIILKPDSTPEHKMSVIRNSQACQYRLQHFPLADAEALSKQLRDEPLWN